MSCELSASPTALVFPGQGAHGPEMLDPFRDAPGWSVHCEQVAHLLGLDPVSAARDARQINRNAVSSLLTVLASVLALELLRRSHPHLPIVGVAGFSVGQYSALFAAGALRAEQLFSLVSERAAIMDACLAANGCEPSGMLAVLGVGRADLLALCDRITRQGALLQITNENAPGQFTLGGTESALAHALHELPALKPRRIHKLPVSGAWHGRLLEPAVAQLDSLLRRRVLREPALPVIDNTTGGWLPASESERRAALCRHVAAPVLWKAGVETLAECRAEQFVEVGYGDVLTKFGALTARGARHVAVAPRARGGRS